MNPATTEKQLYFRNHTRVNFHVPSDPDPKNITYKLFTKENPDKEIILTEENVESQQLAKDVKTILFIHGWTSSDSTPWYRSLKEAYFQQSSCNIIYINWFSYGNLEYRESCSYVKPVGEIMARFLWKSRIPAENIHLIGFSLGVQLAAYTGKTYGKEYGKKVGRITALDPAGPKWASKDMKKEERLNELDAHFVDVIHTDIQVYGYTNPCGHVDFYPNGGTNQPGSTEQEEGNSNHRRAVWFFTESISRQVQASEINFKEDEDYNIIITPKENPKQVIFGQHVNLQDRGVYILKTNPTKPFLI